MCLTMMWNKIRRHHYSKDHEMTQTILEQNDRFGHLIETLPEPILKERVAHFRTAY